MEKETEISTQENFKKCIINTFSSDIGNALVPIKYLHDMTLQEGHRLTAREISLMRENYKRIELILNKFRTLANNNFVGVTITSDCSGFINEVKQTCDATGQEPRRE